MKKLRSVRSVAFFVVALLANAADWPQWGGPERDGTSKELGLVRTWPKEGPKSLWQLNDIGEGYGAPAAVGSRLYVLSNRGLDNEFVKALSIEDSKPLWETRLGKVGNPDQQPNYPMARSTPTVDGDRLYALSSDGDLACLDVATGRVRWQKSLRKDFGGKPGQWAHSESPLVDGDVLVVTPGGAQATMIALSKITGAVIWQSVVPGGDAAGYASAIIVEAGKRKQYVQFLSKGVVGVDAKTGQFLWRYAEPSKGPANIPTPLARGSYVYAGAGRMGGGLVNLKATADGISAEQIYLTRGLPNWIGGSVLLGDYQYGTTGDGFVAVEFASGNIKWKTDRITDGATLYADGHLYVHDENGEMILVEATPDGYRETGRFTLPGQPKHHNPMEKGWAHPVVANGRLYIRDLGTLWCYDIKVVP